MKKIYEDDAVIVTQQDDLTYHLQINNQEKVSSDINTLTSAINTIRNAVWALDVYSGKKIQLFIAIIGETPNAFAMQTDPNNSQFKNFIVLHLDVIVNFAATKMAQKIFEKAAINAGIGAIFGSVMPGIGNASGFIAGVGRVLFLAGVGYFSTAVLSNIYDTLELDELYDYLKNHIFSLNNKYHQEALRNPNEEEIKMLLHNMQQSATAKDIDSLLHSFPHYLQDSKQPLESTNPNSTPTQSNTESTTPTAQSNKQAKDSNNSTTPKNNNPNTKNTNTFPFQLQIKDYNTFAPLGNKQIQLTNIDSKQIYTQTTIKSKSS